MKYYAGYDDIKTDVAVFDTRESRDNWVNSDTFFVRIPLEEKEALNIVGDYQIHIDDNNICWLINECNI